MAFFWFIDNGEQDNQYFQPLDSKRLPRPRGDGPSPRSTAIRAVSVAPPTRGWSLGRTAFRAFHRGCPAHAGMVPIPAFRRGPTSRLPRPRGDGPYLQRVNESFMGVAPPTRGWSVRVDAALGGVAGCPAHAGMVRCRCDIPAISSWLPRPRGDGPQVAARLDKLEQVAPPTRGWSRLDQAPRIDGVGCPAHAGMVPTERKEETMGSRLPRPRGDGPA